MASFASKVSTRDPSTSFWSCSSEKSLKSPTLVFKKSQGFMKYSGSGVRAEVFSRQTRIRCAWLGGLFTDDRSSGAQHRASRPDGRRLFTPREGLGGSRLNCLGRFCRLYFLRGLCQQHFKFRHVCFGFGKRGFCTLYLFSRTPRGLFCVFPPSLGQTRLFLGIGQPAFSARKLDTSHLQLGTQARGIN